MKEFQKLNTQVISIVPHEKQRVKVWQKKARGLYPVLADGGFLASSLYDVAFQMRIHTDTSNTPGTFIIGKDGALKWAYIGKGKRSWADRPKIPAVLAKLKELGAGK